VLKFKNKFGRLRGNVVLLSEVLLDVSKDHAAKQPKAAEPIGH
jgi:hypothetical protein